MNKKILPLFLLMSVLALTLVCAQATISVTTPATFTKTHTQTSFTVTNNGPDAVNLQITLPSTITDGKDHYITISSTSSTTINNLAAGQTSAPINLIYSGDTANFAFGAAESATILVKATSVADSTFTTQSVSLRFVSDFCKYGQNGSSLEISSVEINNNDGDDLEWTPLDEITVRVNVENNGDDKISGTYVELGIIDPKGKNIVTDLGNLDDKRIEIGSLSDGDDKEVEFKFNVPSDFKEDTYFLVVKTYKNGKEAAICASSSSDLDNTYYQTIEGIRQTNEDKQVIVDNIVSSPEEVVQCGDKVQVSADIVNIGDIDYEDQVKVNMYNKELGIDIDKVISGDLNQGDSESVDFDFDVPANAAEKTYTLQFTTYYDFKSGDSYRTTSNEKFLHSLKVQGNCQPVANNNPKVQISAELDPETPEAIAGKQVMIKATIKNLATTPADYTLSVYGNSAWSSLVSIEPATISLAAGESKTAVIVLNVDKDAKGENDFTIKSTSGSYSTEQNVALSVAQSQVQLGSFIDSIVKNWFIYVIILVNLVLIIAIILVIKRMISPRKRDFE